MWMAEGVMRERWQHTSSLMCLIANAHRDPRKTGAFKPSDFDPYSRRDAAVVGSITDMRHLFEPPAKPRTQEAP